MRRSLRTNPCNEPPMKAASTKAYLEQLPADQRKALERLRKQILAAAPGTEEHFGYGLPGFKYNGHPMLYIGAAKNHCALYGSVPIGFKDALKDFKSSKGAIQFTPEVPLPEALVIEMVKAKRDEILERWPMKDVGKGIEVRKSNKEAARKAAKKQ